MVHAVGKSELILFLSLWASWLQADPNGTHILKLTEQDKFQISLPATADHYAILSRSRDLRTWRPVDLTELTQEENFLTDSTPRFEQAYYQWELVPNSRPRDSDRDGRNDLDEFRLFSHGCLALNAARPISLSDGTTFLRDQALFDRLAKRDNFPGAQNVKEVKFLITDITGEPELYFFDVSRHQFHVRFATNVLGFYPGLSASVQNQIFSRETYFSDANRRNLAGSLVSHENYLRPDGKRGIYTLEFWPTDPVPFQYIELAYEMITRCAPFIDLVAYHAPSETQRRIQSQAQDQFEQSFIKTIETEELFGQIDFQPMHQREAFGRLKLAQSNGTLSARDIVIFPVLPNDLTKIAGIITEVPQTPLSHVNLKAQQNDTPNAFIANASTHPDIAPFLGENVFYRVSAEGFEIRIATQQEVDDFFEASRPSSKSFPPRNLSIRQIRPLSRINFLDSSAFGGKASNVAELKRLFPGEAPDGSAIPFYYYDEFMKHNGLYQVAEAMLAEPRFQNDPEYREQQLEDFRREIKNETTFPLWMTQDLLALQNSFPSEVTPRLRSSANAEDSVSFNGAGLYDSFTHKADEGFIGKSVRQVWASLWNYRAYEEREFYRIDHLTSAMGILVHPNEKNEQANGVAVARNIFDPVWEGYYFNVQTGENLVTNPDANSIPEEFLVADLLGEERYEIQYIRFSNQLPEDETVLTKEQILDLVGKLETLNRRFKSLYRSSDPRFAMEIEFKITEDGIISIKQARPYVN